MILSDLNETSTVGSVNIYKLKMVFYKRSALFLLVLFSSCICTLGQKTVLRDHTGRVISDAEFVELRMANFQLADHTKREVLLDGTIELTTGKIFQEETAAPAFDFKFITGEKLSNDELKGKVVVLNLWFIGCPACRAEMPKLNSVAEKFTAEPDVIFVAVTYDDTDKVKKFLKRQDFNYRHVADGSEILRKLPFAGYPKNIVIGRDGKIKYWRSGIKLWDKFESVITDQLNEKL